MILKEFLSFVITAPYLRVTSTKATTNIGDLLPPNPLNDEPCTELGGCFLAGDTRANENTALASMHTVWVRLHNFYAQKIDFIGQFKSSIFPTIAPNAPDRNTIIYEEARKITIGILQHIFYDEWLPRITNVPKYAGYKPAINASVRHGLVSAAFRFGHTLIRNNFERLNNQYQPTPDGPLSVRASFFNNNPIVSDGIEPIMYGLMGDNGDAEDFDNTFSASIGRRLFVPPGSDEFQNLVALNMQRGRDHGLQSYTEYRKLCGIPLAPQVGSNPFTRFSNTITNPQILEDLQRAYGTTDNHIDLFPAAISESPDGNKLLGRTFGCILSKSFDELRTGDRFYYENTDVVSLKQQAEIKKMNMARVLCLTLRDPQTMLENVFEVFIPGKSVRKTCRQLFIEGNLSTDAWLLGSDIKI